MAPRNSSDVERDRYEHRAQRLLAEGDLPRGPAGAASVPLPIREPYTCYHEWIVGATRPGMKALDLCGGTGTFSLSAAEAGARVTISDIAPSNLELARRRAAAAGFTVETLVASAESVPLPTASFDLITCAGSLSYLDLDRFLAEVRRLLRPGGWFLCVDSLNHNPIYRANRYVQFLRGRRSRSTLERMPRLATVRRLHDTFSAGEARFFGWASFTTPLVSALAGEARAARTLHWLDARCPWMQRWAFKFTFRGRVPAP